MDFLVKCKLCNQTFQSPVILPCGHTVCQKHETDEKKNNHEMINCPACNKDHIIPETGFYLNSLAQALIDYGFEDLDLGPEHKVAVESLNMFKDLFDEFKRMCYDPEFEINKVIGDLKNSIDLKQEVTADISLKEKMITLIKELSEYEKWCKSNSSARGTMSESSEISVLALEKNFEGWSKQLKSFYKDVKLWKTIHKCIVDEYKRLQIESDQMRKCLFGGKLAEYQAKQKHICGHKTEPLLILETEIKQNGPFKSKVVKQFGIEWQLEGRLGFEDYFHIFLHAKHDNESADLKTQADLMIVNRICSEKSPIKSCEQSDDNWLLNIWGRFMKLSELTANRMLYDEETNSFKIQANIYDLKWVKKYAHTN